jgi:hypothetical protein
MMRRTMQQSHVVMREGGNATEIGSDQKSWRSLEVLERRLELIRRV